MKQTVHSTYLFALAIFCLPINLQSQTAPSPSDKEIVFVSDTQHPLAIEKIIHHTNHNALATSMIFSDILQRRPMAVYMLGDVVSLGSNSKTWRSADNFLDSCRSRKIPVHALLGNHDVMWTRKKGESNFQKRFQDHQDLGYTAITDSIAVVMLNSNFSKITAAERDRQQQWYRSTLKELDSSDAIQTIIVTCHHAPYSNSRVVGSSKKVQEFFLPDFMKTKKCRLFITGHAHAFEHFTISGKDFLTIGGGGGIHQPLDTSGLSIPDRAARYKPLFHYLTIRREQEKLWLVSRYLTPGFSVFEQGYSIFIYTKL